MKEVASEYHGFSIEVERIRPIEAIRMYLVVVRIEMREFQQMVFPTSY